MPSPVPALGWKRILAPLLAVLCGLALQAQSYQTKFGDIAFDSSKGPATHHGIAQVDIATGAVGIDMPLGPGVGRDDFRYVPALRGRHQPNIPVRAVPIMMDGSRCPLCGQPMPAVIWGESPLGTHLNSAVPNEDMEALLATLGISPGHLYLPPPVPSERPRPEENLSFDLLHEAARFELELHIEGLMDAFPPQSAYYQGPNGEAASINPSHWSGLQDADARGLLKAFGVSQDGSGWHVADAQAPAGLGSHSALKAIDGSAVIPLYHASEAPMQHIRADWFTYATDPFRPIYPHYDGVHSYVPERVLVIKGGLALEYRFLHAPFQEVQYAAGLQVKHKALGSYYQITRMLSRSQGGECIEFSPLNPPPFHDSSYVATWKVGGSAIASVEVTSASVAYSGLPPGQCPKYAMALIGDWGQSLVYGSDWGLLGQRLLLGREKVYATQVREDWPGGEAVTFGYGLAGEQIPLGPTIGRAQYKVLESIAYQKTGRRLEFSYGWYAYLKNSPGFVGYHPLHYPALGYSQGTKTMLPVYAYGATKVVEKDSRAAGPLAVRATTYARQVPSPDLGVGPGSAFQWASTAFHTTVTRPDGSKSLHKFAPPPTDGWSGTGLGDYESSTKLLAFLKAVEISRTDYGTDGATVIKVQDFDRFSFLAHHNPAVAALGPSQISWPQGDYGLNPVPYPTRTRAYDALDNKSMTHELLDWEGDPGSAYRFGRGWKESRQAISAGQISMASKEWSPPANITPAAGDIVIRDLKAFAPNRHAHWLFGLESQAWQARKEGGGPEALGPVASYNWDSSVQWLARLSSITETAGPLSKTTAFTYKGSTGLQAGQLASATVAGSGYSGIGGVSAFGYDHAGRLSSIAPAGHSAGYAQAQDALGRVTGQADLAGLLTAYEYDPAGRLTRICSH